MFASSQDGKDINAELKQLADLLIYLSHTGEQFINVIGAAGTGKSSLLSMVAQELAPNLELIQLKHEPTSDSSKLLAQLQEHLGDIASFEVAFSTYQKVIIIDDADLFSISERHNFEAILKECREKQIPVQVIASSKQSLNAVHIDETALWQDLELPKAIAHKAAPVSYKKSLQVSLILLMILGLVSSSIYFIKYLPTHSTNDKIVALTPTINLQPSYVTDFWYKDVSQVHTGFLSVQDLQQAQILEIPLDKFEFTSDAKQILQRLDELLQQSEQKQKAQEAKQQKLAQKSEPKTKTTNKVEKATKSREVSTKFLRNKPKENFTLQLGLAQSKKELNKLLDGPYKSLDCNWVQLKIDNATRYLIFMGDFATINKAYNANGNLPADAKKLKPWVRSYDKLQQLLID